MGKLRKDKNNNYYFGIICTEPAGLAVLDLTSRTLRHFQTHLSCIHIKRSPVTCKAAPISYLTCQKGEKLHKDGFFFLFFSFFLHSQGLLILYQ